MVWAIDSASCEKSADFSAYGFVKSFVFHKLWKSKNKSTCPLCRVITGRMSRHQEPDEFIAVRVQDPRVQNEGSWTSYVDYKIFLHTNSKAFTAKTSCVRRRYSEFVWLKKKLQKNAGLVPVPDLPKKSIFSFINDDFIERRRKGLQSFLDKVLHMTVCLSDSQLHLFLQTQLPVKHIEDCVQGHTPYTVTEAILSYASSNRGWEQEQDSGAQELWPTPVAYESIESPPSHLPTLQTPEATPQQTPNESADEVYSESRLIDVDLGPPSLNLETHHEQLPEDGINHVKLVVDVHPNVPDYGNPTDEGGTTESEEIEILEDTEDLQRCEYESSPKEQEYVNNQQFKKIDLEMSCGQYAVDIISAGMFTDMRTLGEFNGEMKGNPSCGLEEDSSFIQTPVEEVNRDLTVEIHSNEVSQDLIVVQEENIETGTIMGEIVLNEVNEGLMKISVPCENGVGEEHCTEETLVTEGSELKAKSAEPCSDVLILEAMKEVVITSPVTEVVCHLDSNTAEDNTLVLKAIEIETEQCQDS